MRNTIIIVLLFILLFGTGVAYTANAQQCRSTTGGYCAALSQPTREERSVLSGLAQVPGLEFLPGLGEDASLGQILSALYVFGLGLVGVSALLVLTGGGIRYMTAGDNESSLKEAKSWMKNAVFGLFLALISYLILFTINPDLTKVVDIENLIQKIEINPNAATPPDADTPPNPDGLPAGAVIPGGNSDCSVCQTLACHTTDAINYICL